MIGQQARLILLTDLRKYQDDELCDTEQARFERLRSNAMKTDDTRLQQSGGLILKRFSYLIAKVVSNFPYILNVMP